MRKLSPTNKGLNLFFLTTKTSLWILLAKSKPKFQEFSVACPDCNLQRCPDALCILLIRSRYRADTPPTWGGARGASGRMG